MRFIHRARGAAGALWPLTVIGLIIGALIGIAAVGVSSSDVTASALVRIGQPVDPTQVMTGQTASSDTQAGYVAGEIAYLADPGFSRSVGDKVGHSVSVTAVQNAQSPTITFSATEPSGSDAVATVNAAIDTYRAHVAAQNSARGNAALDALNGAIRDLRRQGGQSVRIEQLDLQRVAIAVQTRRSPDVQVLQSPVESTESATSALLPAVGGALAGALLGLAISLAWRRLAGTVGSRDVIEDEFTSVLRPTVRLGTKTRSPATDVASAATARSLLAQLHIASDTPAHVVVVGTTGKSRSDVVADLLTFAAAEHPGSIEVTDTGALGESGDLIRSIDRATHVITVVNLGVDTLEAAHVAAAVSTGTTTQRSVVCTRSAWWQDPASVPARAASQPVPAAHSHAAHATHGASPAPASDATTTAAAPAAVELTEVEPADVEATELTEVEVPEVTAEDAADSAAEAPAASTADDTVEVAETPAESRVSEVTEVPEVSGESEVSDEADLAHSRASDPVSR